MNEKESEKDRHLRRMISDAVIRPGFRPQTNDEVEAMLDALEGEQFSDDQVERILDKSKGELPVGEREGEGVFYEEPSEEEAGELLAMHRAGGDDIPDDVKAKLDALRKQAEEDVDNDDDSANELET